MRKCDFIIIGQGLAGSLLAYSLIKRGKRVLVIDNDHKNSATKVAAGLINPVTGHRLNISDGFFDHVKQAKKLYWQIERDLGCSVYRPIKQTRLIKNKGQATYLEQRKSQSPYQNILNELDDTGGWFSDRQEYPFGAIGVSETSVIDTKTLIHCMRIWLQERDALAPVSFDYSRLKSGSNSSSKKVSYHDDEIMIEAEKIVFCEGYQATNNPWLNHLPFKLAKGEVLTVKPNAPINRMLSWGKWLIPLINGDMKLGSNYIWNDQSLETNTATAEIFLNEFRQHTKQQASLSRHEVGIRPSTTQRKPFVGALSNFDHAYCLNGLGSKGCLIAPHYVDLLCENLLKQTPLPKEITQWL